MWVFESGTNDLEARGKTGTTSDHANVTAETGLVSHLTLGALDGEEVANLHGTDVLGNVTLLVRLDHEVEESVVVVRRGGRVGNAAPPCHRW